LVSDARRAAASRSLPASSPSSIAGVASQSSTAFVAGAGTGFGEVLVRLLPTDGARALPAAREAGRARG